jgi:SNF2 family DNA or RNA helicase
MTVDVQGRAFTIPNIPDANAHADLKSLPGVLWNASRACWLVPLACAPYVRVFARRNRISLSEAAHAAIERLFDARDEGTPIPDLDLPLRNGRRLFAHQKEGIRFLVRRRRAILADQMGLGKTCQALVAAQCYGIPVHVICPSSLRDNWTREAQDLGMLVYTHSWAKLPASIPGRYVLIADEAHYAQSGTRTKRGAGFLLLADAAEALFCLTGTPMKNGSPANLFPLLRAVRSPLALSKSWFERRYCDARRKTVERWNKSTHEKDTHAIWDTTGASNLEELGRRAGAVMLRRMKDECLDLPEKIRVMRPVDQTPDAKRVYTTTFETALARALERSTTGEVEALARFTFLRMASSAAKVQAAVEITEEILEQGGQVVLFTAYLTSARRLAAHFQNACLLIGETPREERQALVDAFQSGERTVFITTFGAGGVGITLTRAQTVILVDRPWTPGDCYQAEDRIHRIGQTGSSVLSIWLQWDDTDRAVDALLDAKTERIEVVMAGRKQTLTAGMSMQKFAELVA